MGDIAKIISLLAVILLPILFFLIISIVFQIIGLWKIFKKAGKNGWEAIIPYYSTWVLVEISGCKWWYFLILICSLMIPSFSINEKSMSINGIGYLLYYFALFSVNYNVARKFNKDWLFAIGMTLIPFVFYPILGFDKSVFDKNIKVSPYGVIKEGEI